MNKQKLKIINAILSNLTKTINKMSISDGLQNKLSMFKVPKAKKSDLIAKKKEIINKYNLTKINNLWK
tara:strand:+ start:348 stop:551 length:204 start_codon:yes stop_codon:yes gene_type:complete